MSTIVCPMDDERLAETLLKLSDDAVQQQLGLLFRGGGDVERLAADLKQQTDQLLREHIEDAHRSAALLLQLADITGQPRHRALGLRALGNVQGIGTGQHQHAIDCYDEAAALYRSLGAEVDEARAQIGKIWALTCLGRNDEAIQTGTWISQVFEAHGEWLPLADLTLNLASVWSRQGDDQQALALLNRAAALYRQPGVEDGASRMPLVENNRAISLRNLGRFEHSIQASTLAERMLVEELAQPIEAARIRQNLAVTYAILGRFNEALRLREQARSTFLADSRTHDAMLVELEISSGLLHMRRFSDVLETCHLARERFSGQQMRLETAHAFINEAVAYAGLQRHDEALTTLMEARHLFDEEHSPYWVAVIDLEIATVLLHQASFEQCLLTAQVCVTVFHDLGMPVKEAQALLLAARAALALQRLDLASELIHSVIAHAPDIPALLHQGYHLLGVLAERRGQHEQAFHEYDRAIQVLEHLRACLMVEFRIEFLEDKQSVYEDMVRLALERNDVAHALEYAERARSRALLDLLAYRLDLSIHPRATADVALVQEIEHLRTERDRWYRRWQSSMERSADSVQPDGTPPHDERHQAEQTVIGLEKQITERWHTLLIRNADYARDAALWQVRTEPVQPYLDHDTLLIEYFIGSQQITAFLVTQHDVRVHRLAIELPHLQQAMQSFQHHLKSVPRVSPARMPEMVCKARRALQRLYQFLIAPFEQRLADYAKLIIVPHRTLHYLPFHAFHNGSAFLIEQHEVSYLPAASIMRYAAETRPTAGGLVAFGHSHNERLPHAVQEAVMLAQQWHGTAYIEEAATLAQVRTSASQSAMLHFATHGDFRQQNPLFSGLTLSDGQLTTLDIFNLKLSASLVTLSACQTGLSVIGGGDELLGLTRAFLYAGAASLLLTLWKVADHSTLQLMQTFYRSLAAGATRGAALQTAQLRLLHSAEPDSLHPYFWAPFFLIGHTGPLIHAQSTPQNGTMYQ